MITRVRGTVGLLLLLLPVFGDEDGWLFTVGCAGCCAAAQNIENPIRQ